MDIPTVIDVAIGLVVLYFLLSTICSAAVELLASWRKWRKRLLYEAIGRLLTGGETHDAPRPRFWDDTLFASGHAHPGVLDKFWKHPLIRNLAPSGELPSYIEPSSFAAAVVDIAVPGAHDRTIPSTSEGIDRVLDLAARSGEMDLRPLREQILGTFRVHHLSQAADQSASQPLAELRACIEKWYNEAMERLIGQYKRKIHRGLLLVGFVVSACLNADTIRTVYVLGMDDTLRSAVATYGVTLAGSSNAPALPANTNALNILISNEVAVAELRTNLVSQLKQLQHLQQMGFPLGWKDDTDLNFAPYHWLVAQASQTSASWFLLIPLKLLGLLATTLAISLGAPFWFDMLNKIVSLRSSGKRIDPAALPAIKPPAKPDQGGSGPPGLTPAGGGPAPAPVPTSTTAALDLGKDLSDGLMGFNARKACWMAESALLAYAAKEPAMVAIEKNWSLKCALFFDEVEEAQGFLAVGQSIAILAFRGTEPSKFADIEADGKFELVPSPTKAGKTHRGFTEALDKVYSRVEAEVKKLEGTGTLLYLTGHSLGAALATLMAARLSQGKVCGVHAVHTFGSPRVGDADFVRAYEAALGHCTFRVVNGEDLVTRVPPRALHYAHVGQIVYFDTDGRMHLNASFWQRFMETVIEAVKDFKAAAKTALKDHSMELYVRLFKKQFNA